MVSAKDCACASDWKPTEAPPPPKLRVMTLPLLWQVLMSAAKGAQLARPVPENVALSLGLQICEMVQSANHRRGAAGQR